MRTSGHPAMKAMNSPASQRYAPWLWLLLGLFALRVVAQPLALQVDTQLLPRFESWHGGLLPYPVARSHRRSSFCGSRAPSRAFTRRRGLPRACSSASR